MRRKIKHILMALGLMALPMVTTDTVAEASNPFDCHAFKAYDGAGHFQGTVLCYALGQHLERAYMICVISQDGTRVTLYGLYEGNAYPSRTGWQSGICSVSWQIL
jgi:hypothetical protein